MSFLLTAAVVVAIIFSPAWNFHISRRDFWGFVSKNDQKSLGKWLKVELLLCWLISEETAKQHMICYLF